MEELLTDIRQTDQMLIRIKHEHEQYNIRCVELKKRIEAIQYLYSKPDRDRISINRLSMETEQLKNQLKGQSVKLNELLRNLVNKNSETVGKLKVFQEGHVLALLLQWNRNQQLSLNGVPFDNNLDQLQELCERHVQLLLAVRQHIRLLDNLCKVLLPNQFELLERVHAEENKMQVLIEDLVKNSFVVETQPPQVLKIKKIFAVKVRLLVGQSLNLNFNPPKVVVSVINEAQARAGMANTKIMGSESSATLINNEGTMEYKDKRLSIAFNNLRLESKVKRASKRGNEHVVDEKFTLLFKTEFGVGGGEFTFNIWVMSVPVVIVVHTHQECDAWATVFWDNHFSQIGRQPFAVPDQARVGDLVEALSYKFQLELEETRKNEVTGEEYKVPRRALTEEQLKFLAEKAFMAQNVSDWQNKMISWNQFAKQHLPSRHNLPSFTFWQWYYAILKMCKDHLKGMWNDGLITGFIDRKQADHVLSTSQYHGTFIIRFSDSGLGGVTVAWSGPGEQGMGAFSVKPFNTRDLEIRGLANRLGDLKHLHYLFPNIPKDEAFRNYYTTGEMKEHGYYLESQLMTIIPGWSEKENGMAHTHRTQPSSMQEQPARPQINFNHTIINDQIENEYDDNDNASIMSYGSLMHLDLQSEISELSELSETIDFNGCIDFEIQ